MTSTEILLMVFGLLVLAMVGLTVAFYLRHQNLRRRFGPEYDRLTAGNAGPFAVDRQLRDRERRHAKLHLKELDSGTLSWYGEQWQRVQARFVESPETAIGAADELVTRLIGERGYPVGDYDEQLALLSVDHARVLDDYRVAHDIAQQHARGNADTEMLRQALMHYRVLVADILGTDAGLKADALPDAVHPAEMSSATGSPTTYATSAARETAARETAARDTAARDTAARDTAARDTAGETSADALGMPGPSEPRTVPMAGSDADTRVLGEDAQRSYATPTGPGDRDTAADGHTESDSAPPVQSDSAPAVQSDSVPAADREADAQARPREVDHDTAARREAVAERETERDTTAQPEMTDEDVARADEDVARQGDERERRERLRARGTAKVPQGKKTVQSGPGSRTDVDTGDRATTRPRPN